MPAHRLDEAAILLALRDRPAWRREGEAILRRMETRGFMRPLLLANAIGHLAEAANHHPELTVAWGALTIRLRTHVADGLTAADFALARRIDALLDETGGLAPARTPPA